MGKHYKFTKQEKAWEFLWNEIGTMAGLGTLEDPSHAQQSLQEALKEMRDLRIPSEAVYKLCWALRYAQRIGRENA